MDKKVKVLYFVDRMRRGGIQTLLYEYTKFLDKSKIDICFLVLDDGIHYDLEDEISKLGAKIYKLNGIWPNSPFYLIKYNKALNAFFKEHNDFDVVHLHSSSKNFWVLKYAKKYGINTRISHSHNIAFQSKNPLKIFVGNIFKPLLIKYSTDYFACSKEAGIWLFGDKIVNSDKFKVIKNGVDIDKYKYNSEIRNNIRKEYNIKDEEVLLGNVGRFTNQKNHLFLVEIFNDLLKQNDKYKLMLVGIGELENDIKAKLEEYNILDKVIFTGFKTNVNDYLNAIDLFVLPSKYEGLPLVLIEAQANGLKCITSKGVVTEEAKVSSQLDYIELNESTAQWVDYIINCDISRVDTSNSISKSGFDIKDTVAFLQSYYIRS